MFDPYCIGSAFMRNVESTPNSAFIITCKRTISWRSFASESQEIRDFFESEGIFRETVIGIANFDQIKTFQSILALWSLGATPVIIDFRASADEISHIKEATGCRTIFSDFRKLLDQPGFSPMPPMGKLTSKSRQLSFPFHPQAIADFASSSGTIANPKFKQKRTQKLFDDVSQMLTNAERGRWGNIVSCLNLAFPGTRYLWFRNAIAGRSIISVPTFFKIDELDRAIKHIDAEEVTLPPVLISELVNYSMSLGEDVHLPRYPHLLKLQSIGGPLIGEPLINAKRILSPNLCVTYSSTETGVVSRLEGDDIDRRPYSVGKTVCGKAVTIVADDDTPLSQGKVGNIKVQWSDQSATPGDLGFIDPEGYLFVVGRIEDFICRNGVSFYASDLEAQIRKIDGVEDCCIFSVSVELNDDLEVAVAIKGNPEDLTFLKYSIRKNISSLTRPNRILVSKSLPCTSAMKISKSKLVKMIISNPEVFDVI